MTKLMRYKRVIPEMFNKALKAALDKTDLDDQVKRIKKHKCNTDIRSIPVKEGADLDKLSKTLPGFLEWIEPRNEESVRAGKKIYHFH